MEGRRVVLGMAAVVVCVSAGVGGAVPLLVPDVGRPLLFGLLQLPATTAGYAAYGGLTTAALLAVGLLFVELASRLAAE